MVGTDYASSISIETHIVSQRNMSRLAPRPASLGDPGQSVEQHGDEAKLAG